jgi:hypothetical protein
MLIYDNITDRQTDKHIKNIVRNLTKATYRHLLNLSTYLLSIFNYYQSLVLKEKNFIIIISHLFPM